MTKKLIKKLVIGCGVALTCLSLILIGKSLIFGAAQPDSANGRAAAYIIPAAQAQATEPEVLLQPFAGPASSPVTVDGIGWQANEVVTVFVVHESANYAVGTTKIDPQGQFALTFLIPDFWKQQETIEIEATSGQDTASALFTITGLPTPTPTAAPQEPQGMVNTADLNVRSGPGTVYPRLGVVLQNQTMQITGQNSGWWQINYPSAYGEFGWVLAQYITAQNVENVPVVNAPPPPPTPTPLPTPPQPAQQCNPGQWSGCGGGQCQPQYVAQCNSDGQWPAQCTWDPGHCTPGDDNHNDNQISNNCQVVDSDTGTCLCYYGDQNCSSRSDNPDLQWYPTP